MAKTERVKQMIRTVLGDIEPAALGVTYAHEHLLMMPPAHIEDRDLELPSEDAATQDLNFFRAAGGSTIVEMTPRDYGRSAEGLRRISERSGVNVIAVTGFIKEHSAGPLVEGRSINELADEMSRDVTDGINGTNTRAGVIKGGSSLNKITPNEEKVLRAAARAYAATGAPISTHTERGTMALEQVELLLSEGVSTEHILIGHMDRNLDWDYHLAVARTGVTLGFDQISKEKYYPDSQRIDFIKRLISEGFGSQIVLSGDFARKSYFPSYGGGPGLTYILWRFVPLLREHGVEQSAIDQMLIHTPARLFSFRLG